MRTRLAMLAAAFKRELSIYRCALKHPGTPLAAKILLGLAVGYVLLPFDLIPDFLPIIGHVDDVMIVPVLVWLALRMIPGEVLDQCRARYTAFE